MLAFVTRKNFSRLLVGFVLTTVAVGRETVVQAVDYAQLYTRLLIDQVKGLVPVEHKLHVAQKNLGEITAQLEGVLVGVADAEVARDRVAQEVRSIEIENDALAARLRRDAPRSTSASDGSTNVAFAKATKDLRRRDKALYAKKAHLAALEESVSAARSRYAELAAQADNLRVEIELVKADNLRADAETMRHGSANVDFDGFERLENFVGELRRDVDVRLRALALRTTDGEPIELDPSADVEDAVTYLSAR